MLMSQPPCFLLAQVYQRLFLSPLIAIILMLSSAAAQDTALKEGVATNENRATPVDKIRVAEDFQVELLYSVPGEPKRCRS